MNRLNYLVEYLKNEDKRYCQIQIPETEEDKQSVFRALCNVRPPKPISEEFLKVQDEELHYQLLQKGIVNIVDIQIKDKLDERIMLWQGDITRLNADAIVNAANNALLGCFHPLHSCIDNAIHSAAGVQLRLECNKIMQQQGFPEPTGNAKITPAYNLPSKYVIHTVGPIVNSDYPTSEQIELLKKCYESCFNIAVENNLTSLVFCCISTGEYHFPNQLAAKTALSTIRNLLKQSKSDIKVVFNVYKNEDMHIYKKLMQV